MSRGGTGSRCAAYGFNICFDVRYCLKNDRPTEQTLILRVFAKICILMCIQCFLGKNESVGICVII